MTIVLVAATVGAVAVYQAFLTPPDNLAQPNVVHPDGSPYDYTPTQHISADYKFQLQMHADFAALVDRLSKEEAKRLGVEEVPGGDPFTVIGVYTDAALSIPAEVQIYQYANSDEIVITPIENTGAYQAQDAEGASGEVTIRSGSDDDETWGLHHDYYLVRKYSEEGEKLPRPIVTHLVVDGLLPAPQVQTSVDAGGQVSLHWPQVPGATSYIVVTQSTRVLSRGYASTAVLATTSSTSWSNTEKKSVFDDSVDFQNIGLQATDFTADALQNEDFTQTSDPTIYSFGVIATDGNRFSGFNPIDTKATLGNLPYQFAYETAQKAFPEGSHVDSFDELPRTFPYASLDGVTRQTVPQIFTDSIRVDPDEFDCGCLSFAIIGVGTALYQPFTARFDGDVAAFRAAVEAYNATMIASLPPTGTAQFVFSVPDGVDTDEDAVSTIPRVDHPIYGTNDLTKAVAAHLVAHDQVFDVSAVALRPGMPVLRDAFMEAVLQNPYAIGVTGYSTYGTFGSVAVTYSYDTDTTKELQKQLEDKISVVAGSITAATDLEKAEQIDDWLTANGEYDEPAYASLKQTGAVAVDFQYSQDATGILLNGKGVCTSYAKSFDALAKAVGLGSAVVTGTINDSGEGHAWNKVSVDGSYTNVDPTWDDSSDSDQYLAIPNSGFTGPAARTEYPNWVDPTQIENYGG